MYQVPDGWYIVAAGNRTGDAAVARTMSSALANRFCHLEVGANSSSWLDWALVNNLDPRLQDSYDTCLRNCSPWKETKSEDGRVLEVWERVAMELELATEKRLEDDLLHVIVEGLIGEGAALGIHGFPTMEWKDSLTLERCWLRNKSHNPKKDQTRDMQCYLQ